MSSPQRARTIALAVVGSGLVAFAAFFIAAPWASPYVRAGLFVYGFWAAVIGGAVVRFQHLQARARESFARGEGIVARWRVDAAAWRDFAAAERESGRAPGVLLNRLSIPDRVPAEGVEVIVGRDAVQIGESIHRLAGGEPEVTDAILHDHRPPVLELKLYFPGGQRGSPPTTYPPSLHALRFPVAADARPAAGAAIAHYRGGGPRQPEPIDGRFDGSERGLRSKCPRCAHETYRLLAHCPRCGSVLPVRRGLPPRVRGWVLLVVGFILSAGMGVVLMQIGPILLRRDPSQFSGNAVQAWLALGICAAVEMLGLFALWRGLRMIQTGKWRRGNV